eukprot:COSAG02_NODE_12383_length_1555_cov_4.547390_1_plen_152_part_00
MAVDPSAGVPGICGTRSDPMGPLHQRAAGCWMEQAGILLVFSIANSDVVDAQASGPSDWFGPEIQVTEGFADGGVCQSRPWQMLLAALFPFVCRGGVDFLCSFLLQELGCGRFAKVAMSFVPGLAWSLWNYVDTTASPSFLRYVHVGGFPE